MIGDEWRQRGWLMILRRAFDAALLLTVAANAYHVANAAARLICSRRDLRNLPGLDADDLAAYIDRLTTHGL